ncbi:MAG: serine/threonine protein phosphatase [Verrucomicrobiales bacterium]|nr:serine/threonine protein phosphatase [Verrucomicrobiales bacterium]
MSRLLAIGDIHGCREELELLLETVDPGKTDRLVTLGDYVDRGPDSKGVVDRLLALDDETQWIPLLGNHDQMFLEFLEDRSPNPDGWLSVGGWETLASYRDRVPGRHREFFAERCQLWWRPEVVPVFFVHGSAHPHLPLEEQPEEWLLWRRITDQRWPHESGRTMICGHTAQRSGLPLCHPGAICVDTWACGEGWLSCLDVLSGEVVQARAGGRVRRFFLDDLEDAAKRAELLEMD